MEQKGQKGLNVLNVFITKLRKFTLDLNEYEYGFLFNSSREQRHDSLSLWQYIRIYTSSAAILIRKKINFRYTHPQVAPLKASRTLLWIKIYLWDKGSHSVRRYLSYCSVAVQRDHDQANTYEKNKAFNWVLTYSLRC